MLEEITRTFHYSSEIKNCQLEFKLHLHSRRAKWKKNAVISQLVKNKRKNSFRNILCKMKKKQSVTFAACAKKLIKIIGVSDLENW